MRSSKLFLSKAQAVCYAGLWYVSENRPRVENQLASTVDVEASAQDNPDFSILAIAGAMFLLLFIAAADLWAGFALWMEGRDSGGSWFVQRKFFGVFLLGTFAALIGSSVRVLFYSSFENFELVIGAAAVLFIADVVSITRFLSHTCRRAMRMEFSMPLRGALYWHCGTRKTSQPRWLKNVLIVCCIRHDIPRTRRRWGYSRT